MGTYNRFEARAYAQHWANGRNLEQYKDYSHDQGGHGDCTNFISQCLYAGGWTEIHGWEIDPVAWYGPRSAEWLGRTTILDSSNSRTWSAAMWFHEFLKRSGRAEPSTLDKLEIGDIVMMYMNDKLSYPNHAMLVTEVPSGTDVKLSYHSEDHKDRPLSSIKEQYPAKEFEYFKVSHTFSDWPARIRSIIPR